MAIESINYQEYCKILKNNTIYSRMQIYDNNTIYEYNLVKGYNNITKYSYIDFLELNYVYVL